MALTFYEDVAPEVVAEFEHKYAKALKPACMDCGRTLGVRELSKGRLCLNHEACRLRRILHRTPKQWNYLNYHWGR